MTDKSIPNYGATSEPGIYDRPPAYSPGYRPSPPDAAKWNQQQPNAYFPDQNEDPKEDWRQPLLVSGKLAFSERSIRNGFMRKVFALVFLQLLVVTGIVALFTFEENTRLYVQRHSWIYWASYITFFIVFFSISIRDGVRRKVPGNYFALLLLTLSLGYMTGMIASYYETRIVLMALILSAVATGALILFSLQSKVDCTKHIGIVSSLSLLLFIFGLFALIFGVGYGQNVIWLIYSGLAAVLFMAYLVIDVQLLMGNRQFALSPEDYVYAASQIFVDIVYLFLMILQIIGDRK